MSKISHKLSMFSESTEGIWENKPYTPLFAIRVYIPNQGLLGNANKNDSLFRNQHLWLPHDSPVH